MTTTHIALRVSGVGTGFRLFGGGEHPGTRITAACVSVAAETVPGCLLPGWFRVQASTGGVGQYGVGCRALWSGLLLLCTGSNWYE